MFRHVIRGTWKLFVAFAVVYVAGALAFWWFEQELGDKAPTIGESFYYGIVTLSTVGYGDFYPKTTGGQLVAVALILFALTMLGYVLTKISDAVMEARKMEELGMNGTQFDSHLVMLGWSKIAAVTLGELMAADRQVAVLCETSTDLEKVRVYGDKSKLFVTCGNVSNETVLERTNIKYASTIIVCTDDDTQNIILSLMAKKQNPRARIIVSVQREELRETLTANGVTYVASPFELSARLVASAAFEPEVAKFVEDITSGVQGDYDLQQFSVVPTSPARGRTVQQVSELLHENAGPLLVGVAIADGDGWTMQPNPPRDLELNTDDILVVLGSGEQNGLVSDLLGVRQGR